MPSDTIAETFSERVLLELLNPDKPKNILVKFWNSFKTIPTITRLLNWLGLEVVRLNPPFI